MFLAFVWLSQLLIATAVDGGAEAISGGKLIGPTDIDSRYWNSSIDRDSGSLKAGAINNLIDNLGAQTTATVTWKASNTWRIDSGRTTTDEQKLARSYLDNGDGNLVTVSNTPYKKYNLYVLFSPGSGAYLSAHRCNG